MSPREIINKLLAEGMTQKQIADLVTEKGVATSQETISRIASGDFKTTTFERGLAITKLIEDKSAA